jgi:predicted CXXCH cytochrome family protein
MRLKLKHLILFILICSFSGFFMLNNSAHAEKKDDGTLTVDTLKITNFPFGEQNEYCLKCHGNEHYFLTDTVANTKEKRIMCSNYMINRGAFYQSNHKNFACTDCHSEEFKNFPHKVESRMEAKYNCIDCHGGDENFAKYHFEEIQSEYDKSTHAAIEGFTCWKCHNPHSYKITARNSNAILSTIQYDNNICLECHADFQNFSMLTDRKEIDIVKNHGWLPNQVAHFASVRCIECHTRINDTVLVSHELLPKKFAVRKCTECHSSDSRLMTTLYKFQRKEQRKTGFVNGIIINESYVIAANRNVYLNILSLVILGLVVLIISVHVFFRIIKSKKE